MAISMVDQQLADETQSLLNYLLSNSYIIKQDVLTGLPDKLVNSFIDTYCRDHNHHGKEIPIYYAFPNIPPRTAFMLIQFKGSTEDDDSAVLGGVEGQMADNSAGDQVHERLKVQTAHKNAFVTLSSPAYKINQIIQSNQFRLQSDGQTVEIPYTSLLEQQEVYIDVYYEQKNDKSGKSTPIGINTKEGVTLDFIASNTNTIRCLSGLLTYIRVYLKRSLEENGTVYLPELEMNGMDIIQDQQQNQVPGQTLYYRRLQVTYHVTQTLSQGAGKLIKDVQVRKDLSDEESKD